MFRSRLCKQLQHVCVLLWAPLIKHANMHERHTRTCSQALFDLLISVLIFSILHWACVIVCLHIHYLEHNIDLFTQGVGVDQCQFEGNSVGVEEGTGLHTNSNILCITSHCYVVFRDTSQSDLVISDFSTVLIYSRMFLNLHVTQKRQPVNI